MENDLLWVDYYENKNKSSSPFGAQPILPKFGGVFCLCTTSPPKGLELLFLFSWKSTRKRSYSMNLCLVLFAHFFSINTYCHHMCQVNCLFTYFFVLFFRWWQQQLWQIRRRIRWWLSATLVWATWSRQFWRKLCGQRR